MYIFNGVTIFGKYIYNFEKFENNEEKLNVLLNILQKEESNVIIHLNNYRKVPKYKEYKLLGIAVLNNGEKFAPIIDCERYILALAEIDTTGRIHGYQLNIGNYSHLVISGIPTTEECKKLGIEYLIIKNDDEFLHSMPIG